MGYVTQCPAYSLVEPDAETVTAAAVLQGRRWQCRIVTSHEAVKAARRPTERRRMNLFDTILVSINQVLGQFAHSGSSTSSKIALDWGLY